MWRATWYAHKNPLQVGNVTLARTAKGKKGIFCCPFLKSITHYLMAVTYQDSLGSNLWLGSQRHHIPAHPRHPVVRHDVLFHYDINNHSIIVWLHNSYQETQKSIELFMVHNDNEWHLWIRFLVFSGLHMSFFLRPSGKKSTANNLVPKFIFFFFLIQANI